jgi:predicted signal transduction protein with EAL and GGDEF domain
VASPEQLVDRADQALYAAKKAGRCRAVSFGSLQAREATSVGSEGKPYEDAKEWNGQLAVADAL